MTRFFRLVTAAAVCALPVAAHAHGVLRSSDPRAGARLKVSPTEVRLTFNEAVSAGASRIELLGPSGPVVLGVARTEAERRVLVSAANGPWAAGSYKVRWQLAGRDGHPVRGEFTFTLLAEAVLVVAEPAAPLSTVVPAESAQAESATGVAGGVDAPVFVAIRWLTLLAVLVLFGVAVFGMVVAPVLTDGGAVDAWRRARRLGGWAALGALGLGVIRLDAQVRAFGGHLGDVALLRGLMVGTPWGTGLLLQFVGSGVLLWAFRRVGERNTGQRVALLGALTVSLTPALSGHAAAGGVVAVLLDWAHVAGVAGWLGTLVILLVAGLAAARSLDPEQQHPAVKDLVVRFSRVALVSAGLAAMTGVFSAWRHVGSWEGLIASQYGRVLLIKLAVLSMVAATGAWNWRVATPRLGTSAGTTQLKWAATMEVAVAVVVVLVTAVLVATPPPIEASAMASAIETGSAR